MNFFATLFMLFAAIFNIFGIYTVRTDTVSVSTLEETTAVSDGINFGDDDWLPTDTLSIDPDGTDYADMDYVHYDPEAFYAAVDTLNQLSEDGDAQGVVALYDRLYREICYLDSLKALSYVTYSCDVTDPYWTEEMLYTGNLYAEAGDSLCTVCRQIMEGSCADAFADHIGEDAANRFLDYQSLDTRLSSLLEQESLLVSEYYETVNALDSVTYSYLGKTWTTDALNGFEGDNLYSSDFDGYCEVYYGLMKGENDLLGPIYTQLVSLRAQMADIMGYDNYSNYAYEESFGRDYTTEDAQALCDAVKEFSVSYYNSIYYSDLYYEYTYPQPVMDTDALLATLGQYVAQLDAMSDSSVSLADSYQFLCDHGLYSIESGENRSISTYTATSALYQCPFIYINTGGDCYDFISLTHEFGHFTDALYNPSPNLLTSVGSFDLFEIHSTGLTLLLTQYFDSIYTQDADIAQSLALASIVDNVVSGCISDEFQRRVYAAPTMTLDEINQLYAQICSEYGIYEYSDSDYSWMYIPHNFESPLYYISYAVSALASLQLWDMAKTDLPSAVEKYYTVLEKGAYEEGYLTVLNECGLKLFTEEGAAAAICEPALDYLIEHCAPTE